MRWMLAVPRLVGRLRRIPGSTPSLGEKVVMGWAGMRGVVSLSLALALPLPLGGDSTMRATIVFLTLVVIVVTLMFQGTTLLPLVKWLGVGDLAREQREEDEARALAGRAAAAVEAHARGELVESGGISRTGVGPWSHGLPTGKSASPAPVASASIWKSERHWLLRWMRNARSLTICAAMDAWVPRLPNGSTPN